MADPFRKVRPGDPIQIPAATYNAMIDAILVVQSLVRTVGAGGSAVNLPNIVRLRNDSGENVPRYGILGLGNPIITTAESESGFKSNPRFFSGELPAEEDHADRFALVLQAVPDGQTCEGAVGGIFPCKINIVSEDHEFATVEDGEVGRLISSESGPVDILWKESGTGEKWALIRFPAMTSASPFDPRFVLYCTGFSYSMGIRFVADSTPALAYNSGALMVADVQSDPTIEALVDDYYGGPGGCGIAYRNGIGFWYSTRPGKQPKALCWTWTGRDPASGRKTYFPSPYGTFSNTTIPAVFILADTIPRAVITYSTLPYSCMEFGLHGGSVTGTLVAKVGLAQPIGSATLTVTTAADSGALDLKADNELLIGAGVNQKLYRVTVNMAQPNPNSDAVISISPTLEKALTGGEAVVLVSSWTVNTTLIYSNITLLGGGVNQNKRGFPLDKYVMNGRPITNDSSIGQVARSILYWNGTSYEVLLNWIYANGAHNESGCDFYDVAVTNDGKIWAIGSVLRTFGGTPESGFFLYDGGAWTNFIPEIPSGYYMNASQTWGYFSYLPDGRLAASMVLHKASDFTRSNACFYILDSDNAPEPIKSSEGTIILRNSDDSRGAFNFFVGNASTGVELYFWSRTSLRKTSQVIDLPVDEYPQIPPDSIFFLRGSTSTGAITGALAAKSATVQPVGSSTLVVTTAPGTGALDFQIGNHLRVGSGVNARYYFVSSAISQPNPASDATINISPNLLVALAGGEPVVLRDGWATRFEIRGSLASGEGANLVNLK